MRRPPILVLVAAAATVVTASLVFSVTSGHAVTSGKVVVAAAAFAARLDSTHNTCTTTQSDGAEVQGTLGNASGSFLAPVHLPAGATVTLFRYLVRDFSGGTPGTDEENSHAYLVRKTYGAGFGGTTLMAEAHSTGFSADVRAFSDSSIGASVVNDLYAYYVEIVNCDGSIDPVAVRVEYTTP